MAHTDATQLRKNIIDGRLSCQEATAYFSQRSLNFGRRLSLLAQEHYLRAITLAKIRDQELADAKKNGTVD